MGTRVAEIQELTKRELWRFVDSARNPADDLIRGKNLKELIESNRWIHGPQFLQQPLSKWPSNPSEPPGDNNTELRKTTICGLTITSPPVTDGGKYTNWQELLRAVAEDFHGAASLSGHLFASTLHEAGLLVLRRVQIDCFPQDYQLLQSGILVPSTVDYAAFLLSLIVPPSSSMLEDG